jgi:hypothetical protein
MGERDDRLMDDYDRDLERSNRRDAGGEGSTMADLPDQLAGGPHGASPTSQPHVTDDERFHQHARRGQAESPVEDTHYEPPKKKEGHG